MYFKASWLRHGTEKLLNACSFCPTSFSPSLLFFIASTSSSFPPEHRFKSSNVWLQSLCKFIWYAMHLTHNVKSLELLIHQNHLNKISFTKTYARLALRTFSSWFYAHILFSWDIQMSHSLTHASLKHGLLELNWCSYFNEYIYRHFM